MPAGNGLEVHVRKLTYIRYKTKKKTFAKRFAAQAMKAARKLKLKTRRNSARNMTRPIANCIAGELQRHASVPPAPPSGSWSKHKRIY